MSYVSVRNIQAWLERSKFPISSVNQEFLETAKNLLFAELGQMYDTTTWLDEDTTPSIVLNCMAMQIAAFEYRAAVSQDGGEDTYANILEERLQKVICSITSGALVLPDTFPVDTTSSVGGGPAFFPTDISTELESWEEGSSPMSFTMNMEF